MKKFSSEAKFVGFPKSLTCLATVIVLNSVSDWVIVLLGLLFEICLLKVIIMSLKFPRHYSHFLFDLVFEELSVSLLPGLLPCVLPASRQASRWLFECRWAEVGIPEKGCVPWREAACRRESVY